MFSKLGPLFETKFRHAENTDTRQAIRRDESKSGRKKDKQERDTERDQDLWTDSTVVSLEALYAFLSGFLQQQLNKEKQSEETDIQNEKPLSQAVSPEQKAVNAYQTTAHYTQATPTHDMQPEYDPDALSNPDIRIMNNILQNILTLEKRGVTELAIPKQGTFLESLESAVNTALKEI